MRRIERTLVLISLCLLCSCSATTQVEKQHQADMHYKLAIAHLQSNNPTYALKELLTAVKLEPNSSSIQVALAQAYQQKQAYQEAEKHYFKALELEPDNPRYQNNLASLYLDMGEWDKAIEYFDKAANNLLFLNVHIAVTGKGYAYLQKKDYVNALAAFKEAARIAPRYAPAYFHEADVYHALGKADLELKSLQKAVESAPQYLEARYRLASLLIKNHSNKDARKQLQAIINLAPLSEWGQKAKDLQDALDVL